MRIIMKKIFLISLAVAATLFVGCNKETAAPVKNGQTVTISASVDASKVASSAKGKFTWSKGDQLGVWTGAELTPFTLDAGCEGYGYGTFTGTIPAGGAINENSIACFPYDGVTIEGATATLPSLNSGWGCNYPTSAYFLVSSAPSKNENGVVSGFKFNHITAYARITLKNIGASCKALYYESYCPNKDCSYSGFILDGGTYNVVSGEFAPAANDWAFIVLPEHTKVIESLTIVLPLVPANFGTNAKFRLCGCTAASFGNEMEGCNRVAFLDFTNLAAGDYYILPDITFPNESAADDSGSGVNDGIEDSVVKDQGDGFWTVG